MAQGPQAASATELQNYSRKIPSSQLASQTQLLEQSQSNSPNISQPIVSKGSIIQISEPCQSVNNTNINDDINSNQNFASKLNQLHQNQPFPQNQKISQMISSQASNSNQMSFQGYQQQQQPEFHLQNQSQLSFGSSSKNNDNSGQQIGQSSSPFQQQQHHNQLLQQQTQQQQQQHQVSQASHIHQQQLQHQQKQHQLQTQQKTQKGSGIRSNKTNLNRNEISTIPRTVPLQSVREQLSLGTNQSSAQKQKCQSLQSNIYTSQYHQQQQQQLTTNNQNIHQLSSSQNKKSQVQECWSSPSNLSPIQDVSPSIEVAEQKSMEMAKQNEQKEVSFFFFFVTLLIDNNIVCYF